MRILNFGSVNIDHVYEVPHFVRPGETLTSTKFQTFTGGKGCNQSVALAKSGTLVYHAGSVGKDGIWIKEQLNQWGVNTEFLKVTDGVTGHAIIQVNRSGENAIVLNGGANQAITSAQVDETLAHFGEGDLLLLQNEINKLPEIITKAATKGMTIYFNPAPMTKEVLRYPLDKIDLFILNRIEGQGLTNQIESEGILNTMTKRFPDAAILLTLGSKGAVYKKNDINLEVEAIKVEPIDTTAAGDTFIGYYLAEIIRKRPIEEALHLAALASALCITEKGGAISIPLRQKVDEKLGL